MNATQKRAFGIPDKRTRVLQATANQLKRVNNDGQIDAREEARLTGQAQGLMSSGHEDAAAIVDAFLDMSDAGVREKFAAIYTDGIGHVDELKALPGQIARDGLTDSEAQSIRSVFSTRLGALLDSKMVADRIRPSYDAVLIPKAQADFEAGLRPVWDRLMTEPQIGGRINDVIVERVGDKIAYIGRAVSALSVLGADDDKLAELVGAIGTGRFVTLYRELRDDVVDDASARFLPEHLKFVWGESQRIENMRGLVFDLGVGCSRALRDRLITMHEAGVPRADIASMLRSYDGDHAGLTDAMRRRRWLEADEVLPPIPPSNLLEAEGRLVTWGRVLGADGPQGMANSAVATKFAERTLESIAWMIANGMEEPEVNQLLFSYATGDFRKTYAEFAKYYDVPVDMDGPLIQLVGEQPDRAIMAEMKELGFDVDSMQTDELYAKVINPIALILQRGFLFEDVMTEMHRAAQASNPDYELNRHLRNNDPPMLHGSERLIALACE